MSLEALWTVEFASLEEGNQSNMGAGVVIFETERIFGGDNQFYYVGKYEVSNGIIESQVQVINYTGESHSIFGKLDEFKLSIKGKVEIPRMSLSGFVVDDPSKKALILWQKRVELPSPS